MKQILTLLVCSLSLSACAHHLPEPASLEMQQARCRLPVVKLTANEYDNPDEGAGRTYLNTPDRGASLTSAIRSATGGSDPNKPDKVLVLSGGSLHGAFGAGLFYGWMNSRVTGDEPLPPYRVVTGVSTGALQSTFVFLATSTDKHVQDGAIRDASRLDKISFLAARKGSTTNGVAEPGASYLADLAQDYMPERESDLLHLHALQRRSPNKAGLLDLFGHPSLATMDPLRAVIAAELGDETIRGVANEATIAHRKLFVAMVDLANGYGYAADLTRLAQLAVEPGEDDAGDVALVFPGSRAVSHLAES